jgi:uncharacterized protein
MAPRLHRACGLNARSDDMVQEPLAIYGREDVSTGDEKEKGINGAISKRGESGMPDMNTIGVPSLEEFVAKVQEGGGKVLQKMPIPGVGYFATCQDTEGNIFGIIQEDANIK